MNASIVSASAAPLKGSARLRTRPTPARRKGKARTLAVLLSVGVLGSVGVATATEAAPTAGPPGTNYKLVDLGTLGGDYSEAREINARGTVVGISSTASGGFHAFVGDARGLTDLGAVDAGSVRIYISDRGQVAWSTDTAGSVEAGVYRWDPRTGSRRLGSGRAADINDRGQVAGTAAGQAVIWDPVTGRRGLGAPAGGTSSAAEMNNAGQVAGTGVLPDGSSRALRWDARGHRKDLGPGTATAINARGQVAGGVGPCGPAFDKGGFLWSPGSGRTTFSVSPPEGVTDFTFTVADLNDQGLVVGTGVGAYVWDVRGGVRHLDTKGALSSDAVAVNNRGQVAGRWQDPATDTDKAFVWSRKSGLIDLGPFVGIPVSTATDINDSGVVAGLAAGPSGDQHATVWVPRRK